MKHKIAELPAGELLDYAVAKAMGKDVGRNHNGCLCYFESNAVDSHDDLLIPQFSTNWAQGGPILEKEISNHERRVTYFYCNTFVPTESRSRCVWSYGSTLLEAAMRCFAISKLGEEVEIP